MTHTCSQLIVHLDKVISREKKKIKGCGFFKNYSFGLNILIKNEEKSTKNKMS